jgi:hypothetical protein
LERAIADYHKLQALLEEQNIDMNDPQLEVQLKGNQIEIKKVSETNLKLNETN